MTHPTEAAKAVEEVHDSCPGYLTSEMERHWVPELTAIIQASNEAYAAARTRELVEGYEELLAAVTSKGHVDSRDPITWSGSPNQNRRMYAAIDQARALLATHQPTKEV